ncbi:MAG: protein phosphatase 2C domain-containing protein [Candidatus Micrarchaeota archaeon]|nr:protein phosphatase 2C domain-containing protein [Candidatus Micrarchaeota archaeon]
MQSKKTPKRLTTSYSYDSLTDKGSGRLNEDALLCAPNKGLFAVFDGATSLIPFQDGEGRTGAYLASHIASRAFDEVGGDLKHLVSKANLAVRSAMLQEGVDVTNKLSQWTTTVAAVKVKYNSFDWVQVADTNILVIYENGTHKLLVKDYDHDTDSNIMLKQLVKDGVKDIWAGMLDQFKRNRMNSNVTYGFIAGEKEVKFVHSGTESLVGVSDVILFSDGLLFPKEDPTAPDDIKRIARSYGKGGLEGWLSEVRALEASDPGMRKYLRFKPQDDATAVAVTF